MTCKPHVLIVGAGIGGLTCGLALLKKGIDVDVYEQASQLKELGAGIQVSPNASRLLYILGLRAAIEEVCFVPDGKQVRLWNSGKTWNLLDLGAKSEEEYGGPYFMIHRADLHALLAAAVRREKADAIHLGSKSIGFTQGNSRVRLSFADGSYAEGDALVGADGVHSNIRKTLFGEDTPSYTGCMAWRGVVPMDQLPTSIERRVGTNWIGPGAHVIHYPLRGGALMNFVGIVERNTWQNESWTQQGTVEELSADFKRWHPDVHAIIHAMSSPFKWGLFGRLSLPAWTKGLVSLLGDACHPTLPFLAQGAAMAIEDGFILARCFEASACDVETALTRYEIARRERTSQIVQGASDNTQHFHNPALAEPTSADAYVNREWSPERIRKRYEWLYTYDAAFIPI